MKVVDYNPFPHVGRMPDGRKVFYFGEVCVDESKVSKEAVIFLGIAPQITNIVLFTASGAALFAVGENSAFAPFILFGGMLVPLVDFAFNINNPLPASDIRMASANFDVPYPLIAFGGNVMVLAGAALFAYHGYRIFFVPERE